ncbi:MAG: hypothetical protein CVU77_08075 [Elusimicrobia bacterium HGW-Elusimicrobia-1]|nr:MAG: hypothetical protein CVU77_08075 [Elusimicrobia bacterium HGW-Elusimicrobia-1]
MDKTGISHIGTNVMAAVTRGGCMRPAVRNGEVVTALRVNGRTGLIRSGDCVIFDIDGGKFLHRVVRVLPHGLITLDDTASTDEAFVPLSSVAGVCKVFPSGFAGIIWCRVSRQLFRFARIIKNALKRSSTDGNTTFNK